MGKRARKASREERARKTFRDRPHHCHPKHCAYPAPHHRGWRQCAILPFTCICGRKWTPSKTGHGWSPMAELAGPDGKNPVIDVLTQVEPGGYDRIA